MRYLSHGLILPDPVNFDIRKWQANERHNSKLTSYFGLPSVLLLFRPTSFWALFTCGPRTQNAIQILLQPFTYIQQIPGKQFRSELALAFNHWLLIPGEKLAQIGDIVQMLHNSSLL